MEYRYIFTLSLKTIVKYLYIGCQTFECPNRYSTCKFHKGGPKIRTLVVRRAPTGNVMVIQKVKKNCASIFLIFFLRSGPFQKPLKCSLNCTFSQILAHSEQPSAAVTGPGCLPFCCSSRL